LFIDLFQYHSSFDNTFAEFVEVCPVLFEKLDTMSMPVLLKAEIIFLFVSQAPALPEFYPLLLPILSGSLSTESFAYIAASLSLIVEKAREFAIVIPRLGMLDALTQAYASYDGAAGGHYAYLMLLVALMRARDEDFCTSLLKGFDWGKLTMSLISADCSVGAAAFEFLVFTAPVSLSRIITAFGQFWQLLDTVTTALIRGRHEVVIPALSILRLLGRQYPKQMVQFTTESFTETIVSLLQSGVLQFQEGALAFFDEFLNTGVVPLSNLSNWCMEFEDGGGGNALVQLNKGSTAVGQHAAEIGRRFEEIQRAHRNRQ
jgi:hypothetical protein